MKLIFSKKLTIINILCHLLLLLIIFLIPLSPLMSQEKENDKIIRDIKEKYYKLNNYDVYSYMSHDVSLKTMHAAIGLQETKIKFIYSSWQVDAEVDPYMLDYSLEKVIVEYNIAASVFYHIEYLYNNKGNVIFCYFKEVASSENEKHLRFYIHDSRLVEIIRTSFFIDPETETYKDKKEIGRIKNFTKEDKTQFVSVINNGKSYLNFFSTLSLIENVDKGW